jgi:nucleotide-binding universal stress UspA family protein
MTLVHVESPHLETTPIKLDTIVIATDFSRASQRAFEVASQLASRYQASLVISHVMSPLSAAPMTGAESRQIEVDSWVARQKLSVLADRPHARGLDVRTTVALGAIGDEVLGIINQQKADLLVVGTHGGLGLEKLMMGSVAEALFRSSPVPVITVGPRSGNVQLPFKKILFAADLSGRDLRAAQYATSIAEEDDAEIAFLHVLSHKDAERAEAWNEGGERLRELVPVDAEEWCRPVFLVDSGDAAEKILGRAHEISADLIVLSVKTPLMGDHANWSIASKVVRESSCPVLTVRGRL